MTNRPDQRGATTGTAEQRNSPAAAKPGETLLSVENLTVGFRREKDAGVIRVVDEVSFELRRGEVLGLVGESGCGKSVTALSLLRLLPSPPSVRENGRAMFGGRDLLSMPIRELQRVRGGRIGMIFQEPMSALSPLHRIGDQLAETAMLHLPVRPREARALALDWLKRVGLPDAPQRMEDLPHQLSGGMRQRVMLAMAMLPEPEILLADEPTTALDVTVQAQIFELLGRLRGGRTAVLLITHDMGVVWEVCDRVHVMYAGRLVEKGTREAVFAHPSHPYTQGLLAAMPRLHQQAKRLPDIPGQPPTPAEWPKGCRFAPRCPRAVAACGEGMPKWKHVFKEATTSSTSEEPHEAACWRMETGSAERKNEHERM